MSHSPRSSKKRRRDARQIMLAVGAILFVVIFALSGLQTFTLPNTLPTITPTLDPFSQPFPTVPPEGTAVIQTGTYFHPTGLISMSELEGWNRPMDDPEETLIDSGVPLTNRVGATFINSVAQSVVHAYAESESGRSLITADDLSAYYTDARVTEAWARYDGGWRELGRETLNERKLRIDFELYFQGQTYLARQISSADGDWLMVLRIVAPGNNPALLENLSAALDSTFRMWPEALAAPLAWNTIADSGYMIRYPPDWTQTSGGPGRQYVVTGAVDGVDYRLTTRREAHAPLQSEEEARAWLQSVAPRAEVQQVQPLVRNEASGFALSYQDTDADGNRRNGLALVLSTGGAASGETSAETSNTPGALLVALLQADEGGADLRGDDAPDAIRPIANTFIATGTAP